MKQRVIGIIVIADVMFADNVATGKNLYLLNRKRKDDRV